MKTKSDVEIYELWKKKKEAGWTRRDVADLLGMSVGSFRTAVYRGSKSIRYPEQVEEDGEDKISENYAELSSDEPTTVEELLKRYGINPSEWSVVKIIANRWEVGRKHTEKRIVYTSGKKEGFDTDYGTIFKEPLYQLKVWLVRKEPVPVHAVVRPVTFPAPENFKKYHAEDSSIQKAIILADPQIGFRRDFRTGKLTTFHDRLALSAALLIADFNKVDRAVWLGDFLDFPDLSDKFVRSPDMYAITQPSIAEGAWWLKRFSEVCRHQDYIEGNHEQRLETAISKHVPWAYDLRAYTEQGFVEFPVLSVPNLLGLESLGIKWHGGYPNNRVWLNNSLAVEHGNAVSSIPGGTSQKVLNDNGDYSVIFGHVHRYEVASKTIRSRSGQRTIVSACPGFLGKVDTSVPGHKETQNWNQGVFVVTYDRNDFEIKHYPIFDGGVFFHNGRRYMSPDPSIQINKMQGVGF